MRLSLSLVPSALTSPVLDGTVRIDGVDLSIEPSDRVDGISRKMLKYGYDIAEMSLATFVKAREDGAALIGLPVFTGRRFPHAGIGVARGSAGSGVAALAGRRVGMPQFWMTSSVWHRAFLESEFGIGPEAAQWVTVQAERFDDRIPAGGASVRHVEGGSLDEMLAAGELDAVVFPRPIADRFDAEAATCAYADVAEAQLEYHGRTGLFPIMHFVVVRERILDDDPSLADAICRTFETAKARMLDDTRLRTACEPPLYGESLDTALAHFGGDPWPYGLKANRPVLDWFLSAAHRQGLTESRMEVDRLFAAAAWDA